jgi:transcription elongation factor GreA-like protein
MSTRRTVVPEKLPTSTWDAFRLKPRTKLKDSTEVDSAEVYQEKYILIV